MESSPRISFKQDGPEVLPRLSRVVHETGRVGQSRATEELPDSAVCRNVNDEAVKQLFSMVENEGGSGSVQRRGKTLFLELQT